MSKKSEFTLITENPTGYVCINDLRFPYSAGGIRLISGVNEKEVRELSDAMTKKLFSFGLPISGAKAGVDSDNIEDLYNFIANKDVKDLIMGVGDHQFISGPDIGTSEEEYREALKRAGMEDLARPGLLSNPSSEYELPLDNIITAFGVLVAAEEILRENKVDDPLRDKRIVIEGFGKVGTGLAKLLKGRAKVVGISTRYGCIQNSNGFDIDLLLRFQRQYGDRFIYHLTYEVKPVDYLFYIPCDILIPGARTKVITDIIANKIVISQPTAIVPVSNAPYTETGRKILENAGIICFPDFIASAGALIAAMVELAVVGGEKEALDLVNAAITIETRDLLLEAKNYSDKSKSLYQIAEERVLSKKEIMIKQLDSAENVSIQVVAKNMISKYAPHLLKQD